MREQLVVLRSWDKAYINDFIKHAEEHWVLVERLQTASARVRAHAHARKSKGGKGR